MNISFLVGGTLIILICSLFMNACSSLVAYEIFEPNKVVMNTIISSGSSGLFIMLSGHYYNIFIEDERTKETGLTYSFNIHHLCGGILAGLISITGSSANVSLLSASMIGVFGSFIYSYSKKMLERFEIDDPLDISSIHGFCGVWSIIAVGIFDEQKGLKATGNMS